MAGEREPDVDDLRRGQRLKELRVALGYKTHDALAERYVGMEPKTPVVTRPVISRVEGGKIRMTSHEFNEKYARGLDLLPGELVEYMRGRLNLDAVVAASKARSRGENVASLIVDGSHADAPAPVTLAEAGRAPWELYGAQHVEFMVAAREALAGGVSPLQLDSAAERLGWRYKGASPTYEECEAAIREALKKAKSWEAVTGGGREGTEDELEPPPRVPRTRKR